ncbi:MAG: transposase [Candidatus Sumerlaeaceae bacterium]
MTHRGNPREHVFSTAEHREVYLAMLQQYAHHYKLDVWAYCLMTNHIHLIVVPGQPDSMANAIVRAHMRYARWYNRENGWSGHLWANRFYSTVLDEDHLWHGVRYVEANPLRARMVAQAEQYAWSSCAAHATLAPAHTILAPTRPFPGHITSDQWADWINKRAPEPVEAALRLNTSTGRPADSPPFVQNLEAALGRLLSRQKTGRKPKAEQPNATPDLFDPLNA